jgi:hypothetical protein
MSQVLTVRCQRSFARVLTYFFVLLLSSCHMPDPTNPIYREAPETYFAAGPALAAAQAIRAGEVAALDKVFAQHPGLDPNLAGNKGVTLLFWAYAHHSVPMLQALVRHGANVNQVLHLPHERPASEGGPWVEHTHLLNIATEGPEDKLLIALLDLKADPSVKDYQGIPALQNAIYINNYERMKLLLDRGADINGTDSAGTTGVVLLARLNYFEMVHYLLERGADWRPVDGAVAFNVQESEIGNEESIRWQIKVKHWLLAHGVKFPVPTGGAARYTAIRAKWEATPEGHAWRIKLDALGSQPDVVGEPWVQQEDLEWDAMHAWMEREGIPEPPL